MSERSKTREDEVGLCGDCVHAKRIASDRGSVFWMCQLSATDARFPKYPRLPVFACSGYTQKSHAPDSPERAARLK